MKNLIKEYLTFSNREKKGVLVLLFLIAAFGFVPSLMEYFHAEEATDFTGFENEIREMDAQGSAQDTGPEKVSRQFKPVTFVQNCVLSKFDPNSISQAAFEKMGCTKKLAKVICNYRAKGGYFKYKEDLKKIYLMNAREYARLAPFVEIRKNLQDTFRFQRTLKNNPAKVKQVSLPLLINLNTADSAALTLLKGIGPAFALRIVKYRNRLGGFINSGQLREVYGLDSALFCLILPHVFARDSGIKKININTAGVEEFRKHPYFGYRIAQALVNYRQAHGPYKNTEAIRAIVLVHAGLYSKLVPYITTE